MASIIKSLYDMASQALSCQNRLEPYKIASNQIKEIFAWLDQRRRGSVDVSDFYAKFPQLNQAELFYIFKFLDVSRRGAFTEQDLATLATQSSKKVRQQDSIKIFSNLIRVLKASYYLIQEQKKKSSLTQQAIEQIFSQATLNKKENIGLTDLIILFKESGLEVSEQLLIYIKKNIFFKPALTLNQFIQVLSQFTHSEGQSQTSSLSTKIKSFQHRRIEEPSNWPQCRNGDEKMRNTEKINSQIDKILEKYKTVGQVPSFAERKLENQHFKMQVENYSPIEPRRLKNMHEYQAKQQNEIKFNLTKDEFYQKKFAEIEGKKVDLLFNLPSSAGQGSNQINKRRQQLRKGSLERQKIIDEVMNKKRNQYVSNVGKPGMLYNNNLRIQPRQSTETRFSNDLQIQRPITPSSKMSAQSNFDWDALKLHENSNIQRGLMFRPASASKTTSSFFDRNLSKPDLGQFYRKGTENSKIYVSEKENILKKAEEEATRKIEQIERRARLKVMEKRSIAGVYNRWLK